MPVLQALPEDSLQQILDTMTRMELKPGDHIFRKGEPVDAVYVVESGELSVVKPLRQGDEDLGRWSKFCEKKIMIWSIYDLNYDILW